MFLEYEEPIQDECHQNPEDITNCIAPYVWKEIQYYQIQRIGNPGVQTSSKEEPEKFDFYQFRNVHVS